MEAKPQERVLAEKLERSDGRSERIERAKRLKASAEKQANARPASFANRGPGRWMKR